MIKLSIILPVYNVEKFVGSCLDSLLEQNLKYEEYEIICVIDGSPDNSRQVIEQYADRYPNIHIYEQENAGVCIARNNGFNHAKGKYIWFVDPDDMIASNILGDIIRMMDENSADVFEFNYKTCSENTGYKREEIDFGIDGYDREGSSGSVWLSVCRRDYLTDNGIVLNENLSYGEDYLWAFQIKYRRHKSIYTNSALYIYRQRETSAMHIQTSAKRIKRYRDMVLLYSLYCDEYKLNEREGMGEDILTELRHRQQLSIEAALWNLMKTGYSHGEIKEELKSLREMGAYPYKFLFWNLLGRSKINQLKYRLVTFLFPIEAYYLFVAGWFRKKA